MLYDRLFFVLKCLKQTKTLQIAKIHIKTNGSVLELFSPKGVIKTKAKKSRMEIAWNISLSQDGEIFVYENCSSARNASRANVGP